MKRQKIDFIYEIEESCNKAEIYLKNLKKRLIDFDSKENVIKYLYIR